MWRGVRHPDYFREVTEGEGGGHLPGSQATPSQQATTGG